MPRPDNQSKILDHVSESFGTPRRTKRHEHPLRPEGSIVRCPQHPQYQGVSTPRPCLTCWEVYLLEQEARKTAGNTLNSVIPVDFVQAIQAELRDLETRVRREVLEDIQAALHAYLNDDCL